MVLNDTFLIIGGRNLAKELNFFNLNIKYVSAWDFCDIRAASFHGYYGFILAHSEVIQNIRDPNISNNVNQELLLEKFCNLPSKNKYFLSSAAVYGLRVSQKPIKESDHLRGQTSYAKEKISIEDKIKNNFPSIHGVNILRIPGLIYTSNENISQNLFYKVKKIDSKNTGYLEIEHGGEQNRDFCTTEFLADLFRCLPQQKSLQILNVADVEPINIKLFITGILNNEKLKKIKFSTRERKAVHCSLDTQDLDNLIHFKKKSVFQVYGKLKI